MKEKFIEQIYLCVKEIVTSLRLPTGESLFPSFVVSCFIFLSSVISQLVLSISFIHPFGALIAMFILGTILFIERREHNEVRRLYGSFTENVRRAKRWTEDANSKIKATKRKHLDADSEQSEGIK